jgi:molybdenum cofactor cytidylyltransferase
MGRGRIAGIVLAAGYSSRMKECKALLPIGDESLLERAVRALSESGVDPVFVVIGARPEIRTYAERMNVRILENPHFHSGMFSSVRTGIAEILQNPSPVFVLPVDVPLLRKQTISHLRSLPSCDSFIHVPVFCGRSGHPPLIGREVLEPVFSWGGENGLRGFLEVHPEFVRPVPVPDAGIIFDTDTSVELDRCRILETSRAAFPSKSECRAIWDMAATPVAVRRHCHIVAHVVRVFGRIVEREIPVDLRLLDRAARLHDMRKGVAHHAGMGASFLRYWGFSKLASLVEHHQDPSDDSIEEEILSLADKMVFGERIVSLEWRRQDLYRRFSDPIAIAAGEKRLSKATETLRKIERLASMEVREFLSLHS